MQHHELTNEQIIRAGTAAGSWQEVRHQAIYLLLARGVNRTEIARSLQVDVQEVTVKANTAPVFGWCPDSVYGVPYIEHFVQVWGERELAESVAREVDRLAMPFCFRQSITDFGEPGPGSWPGFAAEYWRAKRREDADWKLVLLHRAQRSEEHAATLVAPEQVHQRRALRREAQVLRGFADRTPVVCSMPTRAGSIKSHGQRALQLQGSTLATRLSNYASIAAALFEVVSRPGVDVARLGSLTERTREFAGLAKELECSDPEAVKTYGELVPLRVWRHGVTGLHLECGFSDRLLELLDAVDERQWSREDFAKASREFDELAASFHRVGRELLVNPSDQDILG